jgi:acyl carrier protein
VNGEREVAGRIAAKLGVPVRRVQPDVPLAELVDDSFALVELAVELQETYQVRLDGPDLGRVRTVGQLVALIRDRSAP